MGCSHVEIFQDTDSMEDVDLGYSGFNDKTKVECLCPKCGSRHMIKFHWIGRGTPRKYCQHCRSLSDSEL